MRLIHFVAINLWHVPFHFVPFCLAIKYRKQHLEVWLEWNWARQSLGRRTLRYECHDVESILISFENTHLISQTLSKNWWICTFMQINRRPGLLCTSLCTWSGRCGGDHMKKFSKESKHDLIHFQQKRLFFCAGRGRLGLFILMCITSTLVTFLKLIKYKGFFFTL